MLSSILWCFVCAGLIALSRRYVGQVLWVSINSGCAIGLAIFGYMVAMNAITGN